MQVFYFLPNPFILQQGFRVHTLQPASSVPSNRIFSSLANRFTFLQVAERDRDSSVGIATRYGLDGPDIEFPWGRDFPHPSRPALRPTQPPIQWVPGLSRG